jgi:hypothetical protein
MYTYSAMTGINDMIKLISSDNIEQINTTASAILTLIKSVKFNYVMKYSTPYRVKASDSLLELSRAFSDIETYSSVESENNADVEKLSSLVTTLSELLDGKSRYTCAKIKDYAGDIKPKLCRELISSLEDLFIVGKIDADDINEVYATLKKPVPKKFANKELSSQGKEVYLAIKAAIEDKAQDIKANSVQHYMDLVKIVDPDDSITDEQEFLKAFRRKISDMFALSLCFAYKFSNDKFQDRINDEFDRLLVNAAYNINSRCNGDNTNPTVVVKQVTLGAKGFDLLIQVDDLVLHARAIPVEGHFVRFHYRYIVT